MPRVVCREWLLAVTIVLVAVFPCRADDPRPDDSAPKDELAEARLKYMTRALEKYTVALDGDREHPAKLDPKVTMRWSNPVGDVVDGLLTIYATAPGVRPAMIAHFHLHGPDLNGLRTPSGRISSPARFRSSRPRAEPGSGARTARPRPGKRPHDHPE